jgi:outer membrane receptor protein involved in Fe transport
MSSYSSNRRRLVPFLLASTVLAGVTPASAAIETIIVTAEKRSEDLQKVAASVQALSEQRLQDLNVQNFGDYVKFLPSVTYTQGGQNGGTGGPGFATVTMRGVSSGNDGNHSASLPTVGIYLDEQPVTTIGGAVDIHVYDIARVEALAGPQGTLYGASSEAGTIRIITNRPDPSGFSARYDISANNVDHGGNGFTTEGFVNIPLADNAAIRLVAWQEHDAGYIDNIQGSRIYPTSGLPIDNGPGGTNTARDDYNYVDTYGGRLALEIDLNDMWTITPAIMGQTARANGSFGSDTTLGDLQVQHYMPEYAKDKWYQASLTIEGKFSNFDIVYSGGFMERGLQTANDYSDYSYFYDTLYGYGAFWYDNAFNPIQPTQYILGRDHFSKMSHEVRAASHFDGPVQVVAGLFYERQTHRIEQRYKINDLADILEVPGWPDTIWLTKQNRVDRDYAAFGEVSWDITDQLKLTGGARLYKYDNSLIGFFGFGAGYSSHTGVSQCFAPATISDEPCTNLDKRVEATGWTHKLNLSWQVDEDKMLYATWSTGFRPGGINRRDNPPPDQIPPYQADRLINYEIGWKTTWADGTVRLNGAAYIQDWQNFQFSFLGLNSFTEIHNAGNARIKGVEADVLWQPDDNFTLTAAGAYNDAHLTQDYCGGIISGVLVTTCPSIAYPFPPDSPKGTDLPGVPKFKANGTARYQWMMGNDMTFHVQAAMVYQGSSWSDLRVISMNSITGVKEPVRALLGRQPAFTTFDIAAGLEWGDVSLELTVANLFDKRAQLYRYAECNVLVCGFEPYVITNRPRTIGFRLSQKFGGSE